MVALRVAYGTLLGSARITEREGGRMPKQPGRITPAGRIWFAEEDAAAPRRRRNAEHECRSLARGVRVLDGAAALRTDEAMASRRGKRGSQ
jgi:hypothetical protein